MTTTTLAGTAGRLAGHAVRVYRLIDWAEVAALVLACLQVLIVLLLLAGRLTRRAWDALPALSERLGRWYAARIAPAPAVPLETLTRRQLQQLAGVRRNLPKRELIALISASSSGYGRGSSPWPALVPLRSGPS